MNLEKKSSLASLGLPLLLGALAVRPCAAATTGSGPGLTGFDNGSGKKGEIAQDKKDIKKDQGLIPKDTAAVNKQQAKVNKLIADGLPADDPYLVAQQAKLTQLKNTLQTDQTNLTNAKNELKSDQTDLNNLHKNGSAVDPNTVKQLDNQAKDEKGKDQTQGDFASLADQRSQHDINKDLGNVQTDRLNLAADQASYNQMKKDCNSAHPAYPTACAAALKAVNDDKAKLAADQATLTADRAANAQDKKDEKTAAAAATGDAKTDAALLALQKDQDRIAADEAKTASIGDLQSKIATKKHEINADLGAVATDRDNVNSFCPRIQPDCNDAKQKLKTDNATLKADRGDLSSLNTQLISAKNAANDEAAAKRALFGLEEAADTAARNNLNATATTNASTVVVGAADGTGSGDGSTVNLGGNGGTGGGAGVSTGGSPGSSGASGSSGSGGSSGASGSSGSSGSSGTGSGAGDSSGSGGSSGVGSGAGGSSGTSGSSGTDGTSGGTDTGDGSFGHKWGKS